MPGSTILVVDDEPLITRTLVLILSRFPEFMPIGSTNLSEAFTVVGAIQPDLVLLDAIMPGTTGLAHAIEMREKYGCNVLIMSGYASTCDFLEDLNTEGHEPFEVLAKPIHPNDLLAKIRKMLQRTRQLSPWRSSLTHSLN